MAGVKNGKIVGIWIVHLGFLGVTLFPLTVLGQAEELTSELRRYRQHELSTGYYEDDEVRPRGQRFKGGAPIVGRQFLRLRYDPSETTVRTRTRLSDSHRGISFYQGKTCESPPF